MKRIYLAGPTVFFPDAATHFSKLSALCLEHSLCAVPPADLEDVVRGSPYEVARAIRAENLKRIREAAGVLANLMPFRNPVEPDSGTAYECGYAQALGIPVCGYLPALEPGHAGRITSAFGVEYRNGLPFDKTWGYLVEDFSEPVNLMLACGMPVRGSPEEALEVLTKCLG